VDVFRWRDAVFKTCTLKGRQPWQRVGSEGRSKASKAIENWYVGQLEMLCFLLLDYL
jgi:hypothetical protein